MKRTRLFAAAIAAVLMCGTANAAIVDVTWTGRILGGSDTIGLFGMAGADRTGFAYTAVYRFDTSINFASDPIFGQRVTGGPAADRQ